MYFSFEYHALRFLFEYHVNHSVFFLLFVACVVVVVSCSMCRVNSTMPLVPRDANFALKILLPLTKIEKVHATNVLLVVRPKMAAPNVPIAHRAPLKMVLLDLKCAPIAPSALHKVTRTKKVVRNVSKEKKHQRKEVVFVRRAIWVNSI